MNPGREIMIQPHREYNPRRERHFTLHFFRQTFHTTVTSTPSVARDWLHHLVHFLCRRRRRRGSLMVGLGIQWCAPHITSASTIQICGGSRCLIFQLGRARRIPRVLARFLANRRITFVGVWSDNDLQVLRRLRPEYGLRVRRRLDLRVVAESRGLGVTLSMEDLAQRVLGCSSGVVILPAFLGRSYYWDVFWLSDAQVQYASVNAVASFLIGVELQAGNRN